MPKADRKLLTRIDRFASTWLANPAAKLEFSQLIRDAHALPSFDHQDQWLLDWIDAEAETARRLGIK